jgi:hypothetical protein
METLPKNSIRQVTPNQIVDEVLIGCYLTRMIIDCDDLEEGLSTDVIEELMRRKEDQNK